MRTSEILEKAADVIIDRGWTTGGTFGTNDPWGVKSGTPVCIEGGIAAAAGVDLEPVNGLMELRKCPAYLAVEDYLDERGHHVAGGYVYSWNDQTGRTLDEVLDVLRATAAREREKELVKS